MSSVTSKQDLKYSDGSIQNVPELLQLSIACGWTHYSQADWERLVNLAAQIRLCHDKQNTLLGVGLRTSYQSKSMSSIGMMLTNPAARGKGVGGKIFDDLVSAANKDGEICTLVASEMGRSLYEKKGFVATNSNIFRINADIGDVAEKLKNTNVEGVDVRSFDSVDDAVAKAVGLDTEIFGADRTALMRVLLSQADAKQLLVASRGGSDVGYLAMTRATTSSTLVLGPFAAGDVNVAQALVKAAVVSEASATMVVTFITDGTVAGELLPWLITKGFEMPASSLVCMIHGEFENEGVPGGRGEYVSIASPAWG